jgi:hypothetical protein
MTLLGGKNISLSEISVNTGTPRADATYVMTDDARLSWWQRRLDDLSLEIKAGRYFVPAEEIAAAILFGRPKWGDNPDLVEKTPPSAADGWRVNVGR